MTKRNKIIYWVSTIWLALGPVLLLLLTIISWTFRSNEKKFVSSIA